MRVVKVVLKWLMAVFYVAAGTNHFLQPDFYLRIVPDYLPLHAEIVSISGICEIALGLLVLIPPLTRYAAWGLIALLIAVFPANVHMAVNNIMPPEMPALSPLVRGVLPWVRLPFQGVLIAWAWWYTQPERGSGVLAPSVKQHR